MTLFFFQDNKMFTNDLSFNTVLEMQNDESLWRDCIMKHTQVVEIPSMSNIYIGDTLSTQLHSIIHHGMCVSPK